MDENKLRQWLEEHPGECPPEMPDGAIGVIFPGENTKDYTLLSSLLRPCAHTARRPRLERASTPTSLVLRCCILLGLLAAAAGIPA